MGQARVHQEHHGEEHQGRLGHENQPATIQAVREHSSVETEEDARHDLDESERTDLERRVGQLLELIGHGDVGRLAAARRDEARHVEAPVLAFA